MAGLSGAAGGATGAIRAGRAYVEAYLDSNRLDRGLKAIRTKFNQLGSFLQSTGLKSIMAGAGLAAPLAAATNVFIGFDDAIRMAKAAVGASNEEFERLVDLAKQLGRTTSFSATEVANLMVELGRAGFNVRQIEDMTAAVLNLARATGVTAPEAAGIMSSTIRQFGLDARDAARVADLLTATANKSFSTVQGIGETRGPVGFLAMAHSRPAPAAGGAAPRGRVRRSLYAGRQRPPGGTRPGSGPGRAGGVRSQSIHACSSASSESNP